MKSVNTNFSVSLLITISHGAHKYAIYANQLLTLEKRFSTPISDLAYCSTLWDSAGESLLKPLKSLHRRDIKIILLKHTSLTKEDYKNTMLLPLKTRLMCNKARFMRRKKVPVRHPPISQKKVSINHYLRHCPRTLIVPRPRIGLF